MHNLKELLKERIEKQNISYSHIERVSEISPGTLSKLLNNKTSNPSFEVIASIARVLKISLDELVGIKHQDDKPLFKPPLNRDEKWQEDLALETLITIREITKNKNKDVSSDLVWNIAQQIYYHSLKKHPKEVDKVFAEWLIDQYINTNYF